MAIVSDADLLRLARAAGFSSGEAVTAAAVAIPESRRNTRAINRNTDGSVDRGLWQINSVHGYPADKLFDPAFNARAAREVFEKQGWNAWNAYKDGLHEPHIKRLFKIGFGEGITTEDVGLEDVDDIVTGIAANPVDAFRNVFNLDDIFGQVLSVGLAIVFSTAALALIALGLFRLTGTDAGDLFKAGSTVAGGAGALKAVV